MPFALYQEVLQPSGVEFAISLHLVAPFDYPSSSDVQILGNLVVARANVLKVFEVRRQSSDAMSGDFEPSDGLSGSAETQHMPSADVEMDGQGDGFVSMGELKVTCSTCGRIHSCCSSAVLWCQCNTKPTSSDFVRELTLISLDFPIQTRTRAEVNAKPYETRLHLLREHSLHGVVTGLDKIRTISSSGDGLDRLLVSFRDAKVWQHPSINQCARH